MRQAQHRVAAFFPEDGLSLEVYTQLESHRASTSSYLFTSCVYTSRAKPSRFGSVIIPRPDDTDYRTYNRRLASILTKYALSMMGRDESLYGSWDRALLTLAVTLHYEHAVMQAHVEMGWDRVEYHRPTGLALLENKKMATLAYVIERAVEHYDHRVYVAAVEKARKGGAAHNTHRLSDYLAVRGMSLRAAGKHLGKHPTQVKRLCDWFEDDIHGTERRTDPDTGEIHDAR